MKNNRGVRISVIRMRMHNQSRTIYIEMKCVDTKEQKKRKIIMNET